MKSYAIPFIIVLCFGIGMPVLGEGNLLVVRDEGMYPPNEIVMNGELTGIHIDIIRTIAETLDLDITFQSVPWKLAITMVQAGKADAITYLNPTPEREEFAIFLDENTLSERTFVLLTSPRIASLIDNPLDFEQLRQFTPIGIQATHNTGPQVARLDDLSRNEVETLPQLINLVQSGQIPMALVCWQEFQELYHDSSTIGSLVPLYPAVYSTKAYIAFSKVRQHEELAQQFADALQNFKQTAQYDRLLSRYQQYQQQAFK